MDVESLPIEAKGHTGQVVFDGQFVTITRKGVLARSSVGKGDKRVPLHALTSVQWKPAGPLVNGFIQFAMGGGNERRSSLGSQTNSAVRDENSVVFTRRQQSAFEQLRAAVENGISQLHGSTAPAAAPDSLDQLQKLGKLRESGILTEEEFAAKKAQILGN